MSQFSTHQPPNVFSTEKPDRRPPQITDCRVSAVHQGGVGGLTSSPHPEFTTLSLISSNEVCEEHEITPRLIQDLLENFSSRCCPRSPREILFFPEFWKVSKNKIYKIGLIGDRPGTVWLGSNFRPSIVTGLPRASTIIKKKHAASCNACHAL